MIIPNITPLPPSPQRTDPATFAARADASLTAQETVFTPELNAFASAVNVTQAEMTVLSDTATEQAQIATTQAAAAASSALSAGATIWVSGTTYTAGVSKYSPLDGQVYRRMITGAGTTDPSSDTVNWRVVNGLTSELIVLPFNNLPSMRPSLNLDFANNQALDPRITFTRASTATRTNARGLIEAVASGVPRIDFDPVTGACKGLLIEEQRANLLTYSEQFDNAAWTKINVSITPNAIAAPDGSMTANRQTAVATASIACSRPVSITINTVYTASVFFKAGTAGFLNLSFSDNVDSGCNATVNVSTLATNTSQFGGWTFQSITVTPFSDAWYRVSLTCLSNGSDTTTTVNTTLANAVLSGSATAGQTIYTWGAQLEAGAFPTTYIPTVASQVTRAADVASMTGANFSSWYRQDEGSFVAIASAAFDSSVSLFPTHLSVNDGTLSNRIVIGQRTIDDTIIGTIVNAGVTQTDFSATSSATYSTPNNIALVYKTNDAAIARSGVLSQTDATLTVPTVNRMSIGTNAGTSALNGHIRSLSYYPKRCSNAELQALSTQ